MNFNRLGWDIDLAHRSIWTGAPVVYLTVRMRRRWRWRWRRINWIILPWGSFDKFPFHPTIRIELIRLRVRWRRSNRVQHRRPIVSRKTILDSLPCIVTRRSFRIRLFLFVRILRLTDILLNVNPIRPIFTISLEHQLYNYLEGFTVLCLQFL